MHSRIFQLIQQGGEYDEENLITADWIEDRDMPFADYLADIHPDEFTEEYEWMKSHYKNFSRIQFSIDDEGRHLVTFKKGCQEEYFRDRLIDLKDKVEALTIESFSKDFDYEENKFFLEVFGIKMLIENKYGFHVYEDYPTPMDRFIRELNFADVDEHTYYLGGVVDYHF